jgi:hypothetical protein
LKHGALVVEAWDRIIQLVPVLAVLTPHQMFQSLVYQLFSWMLALVESEARHPELVEEIPGQIHPMLCHRVHRQEYLQRVAQVLPLLHQITQLKLVCRLEQLNIPAALEEPVLRVEVEQARHHLVMEEMDLQAMVALVDLRRALVLVVQLDWQQKMAEMEFQMSKVVVAVVARITTEAEMAAALVVLVVLDIQLHRRPLHPA